MVNGFILMLPLGVLRAIILLKYCKGRCLIYLRLGCLPQFLPGIRMDGLFKLLSNQIKKKKKDEKDEVKTCKDFV